MPVHFGFAGTDIAPERSVKLGGYMARTQRSRGVADSLHAHILSFREDERRLVLVSLDLLGLDRREVDRLSKRLAKLTRLESDDFEIACTHTHAAPNVISSPAIGDIPVEREYLDSLPERLAGAVREAVASEAPLFAGWSSGDVEGVGASRLASGHGEPPVVPVTALRLNEVCAVGFTCHPTVLGHDNLLVSGDLFGAARRSLATRLDTPCVFLQGASADVSTRATRREQTLDEVGRLGDMLADAAHDVLQRVKDNRPVSGLRVRRARVELPLKERLDLEQTRTREQEIEHELMQARTDAPRSELRAMQTALEGLQIERRLAGNDAVDSRCPVFAARVGEIGLVGVGGELPFGLGEEISRRSPLQPTLVLGLAGGYVGYLMGSGAESDGYETLASPYKAGAGDLIAEGVLDLLRKVSDG